MTEAETIVRDQVRTSEDEMRNFILSFLRKSGGCVRQSEVHDAFISEFWDSHGFSCGEQCIITLVALEGDDELNIVNTRGNPTMVHLT